MADTINLADPDDGQSIPSALAASSKKRAKPVKAAEPVAVFAPPATEPEASAEVAAVEADVEAAPAPVADATPAPEPAPEPGAVAAQPVQTPPAAVPAEPQKEAVMATTIENVTAESASKAQAMFSDVNERAKGAMAKSAKLFEEANAFGKGNVEALVESSKIAAKGFESLGQDAAEFGRKSFEEATAAFKTLATVKSPTEFMKLQSDFVRQSFDAFVAETSRSTETMLKLAGEVAQPISNRIAVAAEKMKPAA